MNGKWKENLSDPEALSEILPPDKDKPRLILCLAFVRGMGLVAYSPELGRIVGFQQGVEATVSDYMEDDMVLAIQTAKLEIIVDDRLTIPELKKLGLIDDEREPEPDLEKCPDCGSSLQKETSLTEDDPSLRMCGKCGNVYIVEG